MAYTIGIDYGTNSVRSIVVRSSDGAEIGSHVYNYPSGDQGVLLDSSDHNLARQHPGDYIAGVEASVKGALAEAADSGEFSADQVVGIGVDSTGSSPIPVDKNNHPLALQDAFRGNSNAECWLWKDHTSIDEAAMITSTAAKMRPEYLAKIGTYSSEWFWAKVWHCLNVDATVFDAAYSWVELCDFVPALLCGITDPQKLNAGSAPLGTKASTATNGTDFRTRIPFQHWIPNSLAAIVFAKARRSVLYEATLHFEWKRKL
ncbi:MAG: FGGY family carbohydrate kinase [Verrucomicrobiales bacterium]